MRGPTSVTLCITLVLLLAGMASAQTDEMLDETLIDTLSAARLRLNADDVPVTLSHLHARDDKVAAAPFVRLASRELKLRLMIPRGERCF